jgi:alcohol dehydrogenase
MQGDLLKKILLITKQNSIKKIFLICGQNSFKASGANSTFNTLSKNHEIFTYSKKNDFPEFNELKIISNKILDFAPELVIAVGGGCVIDYAKIANCVFKSNNLANDIKDSSYQIIKKISKVLAIPTTAGSGAEVTSNAVIYIDKIKYSVEGPEITPDFYILAPSLINSSSLKIKASAGFDAISQSIESILSRKSNDTSIGFAVDSLKISIKSFLPHLNNYTFENTSKMCLAANLSGKAISISKTTAPHAVSYPFTSHFGISHGHAVSLTLEKFLKFNFENKNNITDNFDLEKRYEIIFNACGVKNLNDLLKKIKNIKIKANLDDNYKNLGINILKDLPKIISGVNIIRLKNNPIELNKDRLEKILKSD